MRMVCMSFALQISAVPEEEPGCPIKALPAWSWDRGYMNVSRRPLADTQAPNFDLRRVLLPFG